MKRSARYSHAATSLLLDRATRVRCTAVSALLALALVSCARPPYAKTKPPSAEQLLARTNARFTALTVPRATLRPNLHRRLDLMLIAQAPDRFRATVQMAGNELVSIAVNETGYSLRNLIDQGLAPGFYSGPPAACALEYLIGLRMPPHDFVRVLLGGAPELPAPTTVLDQRWRRRRPGAEQLVIENATHRQVLRMRFIAGNWWVERVERARKQEDAAKPEWSVEHVGMHVVTGGVLPERTIFSIATSDTKITIDYQEQTPNPVLEAQNSAPADTWDEADDEGWEEIGEDATAGTASPAADAAARSRSPTPTANERQTIPALFKLEGTGLSARGDVCSRQPN